MGERSLENADSGWKNSGLKAPVLIRECQACWGEFDQALPEKVEAAEIDFEFGEHRLDIAFSNAERMRYGRTHL